VRGLADFREQFEEMGKHRLRYEHACSRRGDGLEVWEQPGWCRVCDRRVAFGVDWVLARHGIVIFRERLKCPRCRFNTGSGSRPPCCADSSSSAPPGCGSTSTSRSPPFYGFARGLDADVTGSEYLGDGRRPGEVVNGIRHEDALCLSFDEASLDFLISNDVFEHVPDIERALAETARVLAPCREAGFEDANALGYYSPLYGHLGDGMQFVIVAEVGR
jgi:SAM-dependent methyltransferase